MDSRLVVTGACVNFSRMSGGWLVLQSTTRRRTACDKCDIMMTICVDVLGSDTRQCMLKYIYYMRT